MKVIQQQGLLKSPKPERNFKEAGIENQKNKKITCNLNKFKLFNSLFPSNC